jgi:RHS repeat-associated protein
MRFPGQRYDAASGLNYNYFRDYEPGTGRYVQSDPIGLSGAISTYLYADADPLVRIDPFGLISSGCCRQNFGDCLEKCMEDRLGPLADYAWRLTGLGALYGAAATNTTVGVSGIATTTTNVGTAVGGQAGRNIGRAIGGQVGGRIGLSVGIRVGFGTTVGLGIGAAGASGYAIGSFIYCSAVCAQDSCYYQ